MRSALVRAARSVRWYVRELTDESAYERYVAHLRKDRPQAPVPSRREVERVRGDRQGAGPRQGFRRC